MREIQVKKQDAASHWIWGAFKMPGRRLHELRACGSSATCRRVHRHARQCLSRGGGEALGAKAGKRLCRCRHAARLPRGDRAAGERGAGEGAGAHVALGWPAGRRRGPSTTQQGVDGDECDRSTLAGTRSARRAEALGPWFHNIDLNGVRTAPDHFLGDYPAVKWRSFADAIPPDLTGKTVLDIGCNGGFYSIEMKRRGAERVLGIDFDDDYLAQARFAAEVTGSTSSSASSRSTTSARSASASTSSSSWACSITCATRCSRST